MDSNYLISGTSQQQNQEFSSSRKQSEEHLKKDHSRHNVPCIYSIQVSIVSVYLVTDMTRQILRNIDQQVS